MSEIPLRTTVAPPLVDWPFKFLDREALIESLAGSLRFCYTQTTDDLFLEIKRDDLAFRFYGQVYNSTGKRAVHGLLGVSSGRRPESK